MGAASPSCLCQRGLARKMRSVVLAALLSSVFAFAIMGVSGEDVFAETAQVAKASGNTAPITEEVEEEEAGEQSFEEAFNSLDSMVDKMDVVAKEAKDPDFLDSPYVPKSNKKAPTSVAAKDPAMTEVDAVLEKTEKDMGEDSTSASITKAKMLATSTTTGEQAQRRVRRSAAAKTARHKSA